MSSDPQPVSLRASDGDRERVVSALRSHAAEGRLDADELETRVGVALAARTQEELTPLLADLPSRRVTRGSRAARCSFRLHLAKFATVMAMLVAIWALTGFGYFWVAWPLLGWGIGLASHGRQVRCATRRRRAGSSVGLKTAV